MCAATVWGLAVNEQSRALRSAAQEFLGRIGQAQGVTARFSEEALEALVALAIKRHRPMRELCAEMFKDYEFGLRLVRRREGVPVVLPREAVEAPDKFLSELVVRAYREDSPNEPSTNSAS